MRGSVPRMPERTPKALRAAIAQHTPKLLPDFDRNWREKIADTYDLAPVPAFMTRWWVEFALARDPSSRPRSTVWKTRHRKPLTMPWRKVS
ncbi:DUF6247 family protein [Streptomyces sp. NPDC001185]|uniref:DUF6247 family protein n=1 Tax=Streptomyces sp. NPDC001185 TaxID=3154380 RepID=UPI00332CE705